jgi:hypothetical protein
MLMDSSIINRGAAEIGQSDILIDQYNSHVQEICIEANLDIVQLREHFYLSYISVH